MVLGAILAYSAAQYYAQKKGIPVEDVFSWSTCPCSSSSSAAAATSDDEEDWVGGNSNDDIINLNHDLLLKSNCSDISIQRNRSKQCHQQRTQQEKASNAPS
jgi:hypothetical protein